MLPVDDILGFWFGSNQSDPDVIKSRSRQWFSRDSAFDAEILEHFGTAVREAIAGHFSVDSETGRVALAHIITLDQFPRNIYRGSAAAFDGDLRALRICRTGMDAGIEQALTPIERIFFHMPLEHSEDAEDQRDSVAVFEKLYEDAPGDFRHLAQKNLDYARDHHAIIERFGRFPHRNAVLQRPSTAAERAYLESEPNRFGQG